MRPCAPHIIRFRRQGSEGYAYFSPAEGMPGGAHGVGADDGREVPREIADAREVVLQHGALRHDVDGVQDQRVLQDVIPEAPDQWEGHVGERRDLQVTLVVGLRVVAWRRLGSGCCGSSLS